MTHQIDPAQRVPKGDHNRRMDLGLGVATFAAEAGITPEQLHEYETTAPDGHFDLLVAQAVGLALERLEANPPPTQKIIT